MRKRVRLIAGLVILLAFAATTLIIARPPERRWIEPVWTKQFKPDQLTEPKVREVHRVGGGIDRVIMSRMAIYRLRVPFEEVEGALREELIGAGWSKMSVVDNSIRAWAKRHPDESGNVSIHHGTTGTIIVVGSSRSLSWPERANHYFRKLFNKPSGRG
jgi:hypothetical protein